MPDDAPPGGETTDDVEQTGQESAPAASTEDPNVSAARREAAKYRRALRDKESELTKLREATKTDTEKALDAARTEGRSAAEREWSAKYRTAVVRTEALQALAGRVVAPKLVLPHLPLDQIEVNEDGTVDTAALTAAVDAVLAEYPFLADGGSAKSVHHADQGPKRPVPKDQDPNVLLRYALTGRPPST